MTYLFADSHDWEGSSPALRTKSVEDSKGCDTGPEVFGSKGVFTFDWIGDADPGLLVDKAGGAADELCVDGAGTGTAADWAAAATARASSLGTAPEATGALGEMPAWSWRNDSDTEAGIGAGFFVIVEPSPGATNLEFSAAGTVTGAVVAAGRVGPAAWGTLSCPRHFFSSHSTQSTRPEKTGKPQDPHLCKPRNTGGT